jgi:hypothetical protein
VSLHWFFGTCWSCFMEMALESPDIVLMCEPPLPHSVECCEPPDIVLSIVKSDPFWVGALQLTWFKIEVQVTENVQRLLEECCM